MTYGSRAKRNGSGSITAPIVVVRSRKAKLKHRRTLVSSNLNMSEKESINPIKSSKSERD